MFANSFNISFPTSLCCHSEVRDPHIILVYILMHLLVLGDFILTWKSEDFAT